MTAITPDAQVARMWEHIRGFHAVHHVHTGARLGLFAALRAAKGGLTPAALASQMKLHEPYVTVWCETGCHYGLLDAAPGGAFTLAPHIDLILADPGGPRHLAPYFTTAVEHIAADMVRYPELFRTGGTYTFQEHGHEFSKAISEITGGLQMVVAKRLLPAVPGVKEQLAAGARVLDMGCGAGGLLIRLAQTHPKLVGVGVDVDQHGIELARLHVDEAGLGARITIEHLSGSEIGHKDAFDIVTLFEVLHEVPAAIRPQVIANCHKALEPGGLLFILDETYPSGPEDLRKPEYAFSIQTAFNELVWGNTIPTREEQERLLGDAGFVGVERSMLGEAFTILTARKA
jgi:SAM-dependent methyltransferase